MVKKGYTLTEKECIILKYFIENESCVMNGFGFTLKSPIIHKCKDGISHFLAYPAKIEKDLKPSSTLNENFVEIESTLENPTSYNKENLGGVNKQRTQSSQVSRKWAIEICKDFYNKGILDFEMHRPPRQKNETEHYYLRHDLEAFKKIFKMLMVNWDYVLMHSFLSEIFFQNNLNESFIKQILSEKKVEMGRLIDIWDWEPSQARYLFNNISKKHDFTFEEYILQMFRQKYFNENINCSFSHSISLRLPVLPEDEKHEKLKVIEEINNRIFKENSSLYCNSSSIVDHYSRFQKNKWIIPLLSLIQSSPKALEEFLYGNWKIDEPYRYAFSHDGSRLFDYPFFRILFSAVSDVALNPYVENMNIESAVFRSDYRDNNDTSKFLFKISMNTGIDVYFDAGFSTFEDAIGCENGDVILRPKEDNYWTKAWFNYSWRARPLRIENILDFDAFVQTIVRKENALNKLLYDRIPNYMKNILLNYSSLVEVNNDFKNDFLFAINGIIFSSNFMTEINYKTLAITEYTVKQIEYSHQMEMDILDSKLDKLNRVHDINHLIFEDAFENVIRKEIRIFYDENGVHTVMEDAGDVN
jgi:hypothetical protein